MYTPFTTSTILSLLALLICQVSLTTTFGAVKLTDIEIHSRELPMYLLTSNSSANIRSPIDTTRPSVNITSPTYPPTTTTGKIVIEGSASDSESGIRNVSAAAHIFPFKGAFPVSLASGPIPSSANNWSHWSVPLIINATGTYRVVIEAKDNSGNVNYAETTINAALPEKNFVPATKQSTPRISFVRPTFTEAAYQEHGFYRFYFKYGFPPFGKNITTDIDMLTVKTPKSVSEFPGNDLRHLTNLTSLIPLNGTELHDVSYDYFPNPQKFWLPFIDHMKKVAPNATLTVMRDEDVHDGHIFYQGNNKSNAFDILLLFHNEYVTQEEYDNLRQFVGNGGIIVFIDANPFYAEVRYDRYNNTISLVEGHNWKFDGEMATRSVPERWYNDTKEWVGSNFLANDINENITFSNNPFNYTHFEEQYVNNPNAKILMDYKVNLPKNYEIIHSKKGEFPIDKNANDITIAAYSLKYGKGKVIMTSLTARLLVKDEHFMKFFDNELLLKEVCFEFQSC